MVAGDEVDSIHAHNYLRYTAKKTVVQNNVVAFQMPFFHPFRNVCMFLKRKVHSLNQTLAIL